MPQEIDLKKLEGEIYPIEVQLNAADGAVDTDIYEVYGAAEAGRTRHSFAVQTTDKPGVYNVEIPALSFKKNPYWDYQLCVRRRTTGHEWLILQGRIVLRYRIADVPDTKIGAPQQVFEATLSADSMKVDVHEIAGVKGETGASAYEIAVKHGFEGTEKEWVDSFQKGDKGDKGDRGERGFSAYEIAMQNGFEGTEAEWLESLKSDAAAQATAAVQEYLNIAQQAAQDALNAQILAESAAINALQAVIDKSEE